MNRRQFIDRSLLAFLASTAVACTERKRTLLEKNQVLACFGDSITASEIGYVKILQDRYFASHPELNLDFFNYGKSSETITGLTEKVHPGPRPNLFERLDTELEKKPLDIAFFCYGINCGIYGPPSDQLFISYKNGLDAILKRMKRDNIGVVLLTPPPLALDVVLKVQTNAIDDFGYLNPYPEYDKEVIQEFKKIVLSLENDSILKKIDIHTPLYENRLDCYVSDPIHPNQRGHELIASTIIEKIGI